MVFFEVMVQFGQTARGGDADRGLRRSIVDHVLPFLRRPIETAALFEVLSRLKMHLQRRLVAIGIELQGLAGRLFRGGRVAAANLGFGNEIEQIGRLGDRRLAALFHEARRRPVLLIDQPIQQSGQFGRFAAAELDQPFDAAGGVRAAIDLPQRRNLESQQALDDRTTRCRAAAGTAVLLPRRRVASRASASAWGSCLACNQARTHRAGARRQVPRPFCSVAARSAFAASPALASSSRRAAVFATGSDRS